MIGMQGELFSQPAKSAVEPFGEFAGLSCLSIKQPWAWLIVNGYKDVENRTWSTNFRGRFLIHAGKSFDEEGYESVEEILFQADWDLRLPPMESFDRGGVVGEAVLVDCVERMESPWFFGPHGFVLKDAKPLEFSPCRGKLGFFKLGAIG